ncbi:DUF4160 domain-containing protein [Hippea alviniae]
MYCAPSEHEPPHIHAYYQYKVAIKIEDGEVIAEKFTS